MKDKIKFLDAFPPEWWSDIDRNRNVFEDIYYTVRAKIDNVVDFFRHIMFFCENIIKFRHILWNDRDWDYAYILDILKLKMESTRDLIVGNQFIADADKVGKQIDTALEHLNNFVYYDDIFEDKHQDLLRQAINETDKNKKSELEHYYITEQYKFEEKAWLNLWCTVSKYMRGWWE